MDYDPPPPSGPPPNRVKSLERAVERPGAVRAAPKEVAPVEAPPCEFVRGKRFGRVIAALYYVTSKRAAKRFREHWESQHLAIKVLAFLLLNSRRACDPQAR